MKPLLSILFITLNLFSYSQKHYAKSILDTLCSDYYSGRGYVNNGVKKAADFLVSELKNIGVQSYKKEPYIQDYTFGVNTFPYEIEVALGDKDLIAGQDYLLNSNSGTAQGDFRTIELNTDNYLQTESQPNNKKSIVIFNFTNLTNRDSVGYFYGLAVKTAKYVPVIWIQKSKMMYSVGRRTFKYPMIIIDQKAYLKTKYISLKINNKYIPQYKNQNVIGYIPAKKKRLFKPEKYIVLSAHFDHLGKMGQAMFPGANDNASGVAMLLSMAKHYVKNPVDYGIIFCFFSGEEAGLEGSKYFVSHPYFKLKKVKFVLNVDIMGGASESITLVNGTIHTKYFDKMIQINTEKGYINKIIKRGPTANSDHHFFSESGVPAFFIYSGGNVKNYHDIYDTSENTPLNKFDEVQSLLHDFISDL
jgi:aminopeptidase YwaD